MKAFSVISIVLLVAALLIMIPGCKKDSTGPTGTSGPVLSLDLDSLAYGDTTKTLSFKISNTGSGELTWVVTKVTDNGKPWICGLAPISGTTVAGEHEHIIVDVDRTGLSTGACCGWVNVASNVGKDSVKILVNVVRVYDFYDDFSQGDGKWTFAGGTHSISNGALTMVSTEYYQVSAQSATFSPYLDIPWTLIGDVAVLGSSTAETDNGISVAINDAGSYAVQHMWLSVRKNSSSRNWIWLWWIPSLATEWMPWDNTCYGTSSYVYTDGRTNTFEMSAAADESFTLKANGYVLTAANQAVNAMESMAGIDITLKAMYLKLRGGTGTTTKWDNISFDSETSGLQPVVRNPVPAPPTQQDVDGIFERINRGEDVTLKSLLNKKLGLE